MKENIKNYIFFVFLLLFLFINLISSQTISPLYFGFISEDKKSMISFLQNIKNLSIFNKELDKSKIIFGNNIENDVFQPDIEKNNKIKVFEQLLQKNPQSRDILYALYQLYSQKGNIITAKKYLMQAKMIDPNII